jgi:uncharacterized Fe-S cluster protein YjdI/CDGSH-type Zn-finger protein
MASKEIVKRYEKDGFTIVWKPAKCIHSEICVKTLPEVYRPNEKPWIQPESAEISELRAQIGRCPSGALTYEESKSQSQLNIKEMTEIQVVKGGPLIVKSDCKLEGADGNVETREGTTAFCRCGASSNKPFCDGSHRKVDFE